VRAELAKDWQQATRIVLVMRRHAIRGPAAGSVLGEVARLEPGGEGPPLGGREHEGRAPGSLESRTAMIRGRLLATSTQAPPLPVL
jgi:hypothetical protein